MHAYVSVYLRRSDKYMSFVHAYASQVPASDKFEPLMTLYLTKDTTPDDIKAAVAGVCVCMHVCMYKCKYVCM